MAQTQRNEEAARQAACNVDGRYRLAALRRETAAPPAHSNVPISSWN